ncbi:MAG: hypothetical protein Q7S84_02040 [bacterium]|nr:hypothetical protein [bacterium]
MSNRRRLALIPVVEGRDFFEQSEVLFCRDRVSFSAEVDSDDLAGSIERLESKPLPEGVKVLLRKRDFSSANITFELLESKPLPKRTETLLRECNAAPLDLCGNHIRFLYSGAFSSFIPPRGFSRMDWAVLLFVQSMPPDTPILLFWF